MSRLPEYQSAPDDNHTGGGREEPDMRVMFARNVPAPKNWPIFDRFSRRDDAMRPVDCPSLIILDDIGKIKKTLDSQADTK